MINSPVKVIFVALLPVSARAERDGHPAQVFSTKCRVGDHQSEGSGYPIYPTHAFYVNFSKMGCRVSELH